MVLCASSLSGCGTAGDEKSGTGHPRIVTTIFPEYDWARQILGDVSPDAELILLTEKGVDLHSFQPGAKDIVDIATCDVLIHVGGTSDQFIDDVLESGRNENMKIVELLNAVQERVKEEEITEGMEEEEEEGDEAELDEHVWLSLKNAELAVDAICEAISEADPEHAEEYRKNAEKYKESLKELDSEYEEMVKDAKRSTLVFGDRFPFRYLLDDYGIDYYAAFPGCSSETEASFETVTFLAEKVDELKLKHILVIENSDMRVAQTIADSCRTESPEILTLDSMQAVSRDRITDGATYLDIMRSDLEVIRTALN